MALTALAQQRQTVPIPPTPQLQQQQLGSSNRGGGRPPVIKTETASSGPTGFGDPFANTGYFRKRR